MSREQPEQTVNVIACKYDGREHRRWQASIVRREGTLIVLDAKFEEEIRRDLLGVVASGTLSIEYYWLDRWYNVFRFHEPTGELRNYYCNLNVPPTFDGRVLRYIDLEIDLLVSPDLSYTVLDEEEFETNAARYHYPAQLRSRVRQALDEMVALIEARQFPFDLHS